MPLATPSGLKRTLFNGHLKASHESQILNVDIATESGKLVKQFRLPVLSGLTWGNIALSEKDFRQGKYTYSARIPTGCATLVTGIFFIKKFIWPAIMKTTGW